MARLNVSQAKNHPLLRAKIHVRRSDETALAFVGNVTEAKVGGSTNTLKEYDYAEDTAPQIVELDTTTDLSLSLKMAENVYANMRNALAGKDTAGVAVQTAGSVLVGAPENVVARLGGIVWLAKRNISALTIKNAADTTTYVAGTDYAIHDAERGIIAILAGGAIADAATLHASYTYGTAPALKTFGVAANPLQEFEIYVMGKAKNGLRYDWNVWRCRLVLDGDLELIGTNALNVITVKGSILADSANHSGDERFLKVTQMDAD